MSVGLYRENPLEYLNQPNVVMIGLAEKKADKKFMGMATDQRRLFAVNKDTGDITYYKLREQLQLEITGECCNQEELRKKIFLPGSNIVQGYLEKRIIFKGFIPGSGIKKIEFDKSGTQANKGPEINIYTDLNNRIYTLYFQFGERSDRSAMQMRDNINATGKFTVTEQTGGAKRKTRRNRRKHKKQTHKKHSRKHRTRKHTGKRGKKLAKKSRKHRRKH